MSHPPAQLGTVRLPLEGSNCPLPARGMSLCDVFAAMAGCRRDQGPRRRLSMDANPWRSFSRIVASCHYLRPPDVPEQFLSACRTPEGSPHLPWDLLIVDECHHLMPSPCSRLSAGERSGAGEAAGEGDGDGV